jgi:hypothetical protein
MLFRWAMSLGEHMPLAAREHDMGTPRVSGDSDALLVFADIIDSSKFSSVLGIREYGKRLLEFQQLFKSLGERYFPPLADRTQGFCQVDARGDEGIIFALTRDTKQKREFIFRAIEFLYHLKGLLYLGLGEATNQRSESAPVRMGLGAGIHCGRVAFSTELQGNRLEIVQIDGFAINKAKRVESASRQGRFSRILLSMEAARLLEGEPLLLSHIRAPMKGIDEHADLYEVKAGLFSGINLMADTKMDQSLIDKAREFAKYPGSIDEVWIKSLVISILEVMLQRAMVQMHKTGYYSHQLDIAWSSTIEDDPILLYLRAKDCQTRGKYTQQIRYLKQILEKHPDFVFAKKRMVEACWKITEESKETAEMVYARDIAEEFLSKFSQFLSNEEKERFAEIINYRKE